MFGKIKELLNPNEERIKFLLSNLDDEHLNIPPSVVSMRKERLDPEILSQPNVVKYLASLEELYSHITWTNSPEVDSESTRFITDYINKGLQKIGREKDVGSIRVIILNKSSDANAYALPDGTVVLTQDLINKFGSLDALMGVVFHEVTHILNKDHSKQFKTNNHQNSFSQGFVDEISADLKLVTSLLESVDLNSTGLEKALKEIEIASKNQGPSRDVVHQEAAQRQYTINLQHATIHSSTSSKELSQIPGHLRKVSRPSNLDIVEELLMYGNRESISKCLSLMNGYSLEKIYPYASRLYTKEISEEYRKRLREEGFSESQIQYFFFCHFRNSPLNTEKKIYKKPNFITKSSDLLKVSENLDRLDSSDGESTYMKALSCLYGRKVENISRYKILESLGFCVRGVKSKKYSPEEGLPLDSKTLVQVLENCAKYFKNINSEPDPKLSDSLNLVIERYFMNLLEENFSEIENFFILLKNSQLDSSLVMNLINSAVFQNNNLPNRKKVLKIIKKVFGFTYEDRSEKTKKEGKDKGIDFSIPNFQKILYESKDFNLTQLSILFKTTILRELPSYLVEKNVSEKDREKYLETLFSFIEKLDFNNPNSNFFVPEYLKNEGVKTSDVKKISVFNLKMLTLSVIFQNDSEYFYKKIEEIAAESEIDFSKLTNYELVRLLTPLLDIDSNKYIMNGLLYAFGVDDSSHLEFKSVQRVDINRNDDYIPPKYLGVKIQNLDRFEKITVIQEYLSRATAEFRPSSLKELHREFYDSKAELSAGETNSVIFLESLRALVTFRKVREGLLHLLKEQDVSKMDSRLLYSLCQEILPRSITKDELLKKILIQFIKGNDSFEKKLEFFKKNYASFSYEDILVLVEQIDREDQPKNETSWDRWLKFKNTYNQLIENFETGENSAIIPHSLDYMLSALGSDKSEFILNSVSDSKKNSREQTTALASIWSENFFLRDNSSSGNREISNFNIVTFVDELKKFNVSSEVRDMFLSFKDTIQALQNLNSLQRMYLVQKILISEEGKLRTDEGRKELGRLLRESLGLTDPFLLEFVSQVTSQAKEGTNTRDLLLLLSSDLLGNKLFSSLNLDNTNFEKVFKDVFKTKKLSQNYLRQPIQAPRSFNTFREVLQKKTREVLVFGNQFFNKDSKVITSLLRESDETYNEVIQILSKAFGINQPVPSVNLNTEVKIESNDIPENITALLNILKSTILGTRALQITSQMRSFNNPSLSKELALSFDANPGMDRLRFYLALDSASERDPELKKYLKNNLVRIGPKLGGGSMATTYQVEVRDAKDPRSSIKVALRALAPGSKIQVERISEAVEEAVNSIISKRKRFFENSADFREKIKNAKLMKIVAKLARDWCIYDIDDPSYESRDDIFRESVLKSFTSSGYSFAAPQRILTSRENWVRIEELAQGESLRNFLDNPTVPDSQKREAVKQVYMFNRFQYSKELLLKNGGRSLVQSDPSIGNYLVEVVNGELKISVLDRGLMIEIDEKRCEMVNLLIEGNMLKFFNSFLNQIIDFNFENNPSYQVLSESEKKRLRFNLQVSSTLKMFSKSVFSRERSPEGLIANFNELLLDYKLDFPIDLQLILKNVLGLERLKQNYSK